MIALGATEVLNIRMFEGQIAPVVYLNGTILFVAGLAVIRAHNRWLWNWRTFITLWLGVVAGRSYRMIAPQAPQTHAGAASYAMFATLVVIGLGPTYKGYMPERSGA